MAAPSGFMGDLDVLNRDETAADDAVTLLPGWYMPAPTGGCVGGWRRLVALLIVAAFLTITAFGLCNTYGDLGL